MKNKRKAGKRRSRFKHHMQHLRPMQVSDVPQVVHIEARAYPSPWTEESFRQCLQAGCCCLVVEHDGVVVAYGIMSIDATNAHILNVCVQPAWQRHGLGRTVLVHLLTLAGDHQAQTVLLYVRVSNLPAIRLYESTGFLYIGREAGYYHMPQGQEDAFMMARRL